MAKKGICKRKLAQIKTVTVTERGQIAIPSLMREELDINKGDKLFALKRKDGNGINLIKVKALESFVNKFSRD